MTMTKHIPNVDKSGVPLSENTTPGISIFALGMSLGLFLAVSFVLCVLFDLLFPGYAMNRVWAPLFPGFTWLNWPGFFIGLAESFAYGWYVAVIFGPLYNFFTSRSAKAARQ